VGVVLPGGVGLLVVGMGLLVVGVELLVELPVELPEDPQPTASATAAQVISVEAPRFIPAGTLA
jgi:hypothetical protein